MTALPDYIVTTGDFISEWMDDEGINAAELARRLDVTRKHVSELLRGIAPLSHPLALALERVTGVPSRIWNQYESGYRDDLARLEEKAKLEAQYDEAKVFPLAYLRKWGFITAPARDHPETVQQLLAVLGVATLDALDATWSRGVVAYRRATVGRDDAPALTTWLALAERQHDAIHAMPSYDRAALLDVIPRLRAMTTEDPVTATARAVDALRDVGVVLCFIPAVPGLGIHGATRWVNERPIVQLSLLRKSNDQFWFTLFHELGHVLLHSDRDLYLQGAGTEAEREADDYAANVLIPAEYEPRLPRRRDMAAVTQLADELGVAPGIVLGRAQRATGDYAWGQQLRVTLEFAALARADNAAPDHAQLTDESKRKHLP